MKQTANYKLSQWELTDRIQMADFNSDNAKLDTAVAAALAKAVSEGKRLDTALSTAKTQLQSSIDTNKTQLQSTIASNKTQLQSAIDGVESRLTKSLNTVKTDLAKEDTRLNSSKLELTTLMTATLAATTTGSRQADVSGIDFGSYLMISICLEGLSGARFTFNGANATYAFPGSNSPYSGSLGSINSLSQGTFLFFPMKNPASCITCRQVSGGYTSGYMELRYRDIKTLDITGGGSSSLTLTIKGVK